MPLCRRAIHECSSLVKHVGVLTTIALICAAGVYPLPCEGQTTSWNTNGSNIWYSPTGINVGIGTASPRQTLDVFGVVATSTGFIMYDRATNSLSSQWYSPAPGDTRLYDQLTGSWRLVVNSSGNVGIGTAAPQYKLSVNGTIGTKEVIVTNTGWSDYVFKPDYRLKPLKEIAAYIKVNHHLPEIPSEADVQEKGVSVGEMQAKLLAKVEELTLHMIQAEERNDRLEQVNRRLQERISRLEGRTAR